MWRICCNIDSERAWFGITQVARVTVGNIPHLADHALTPADSLAQSRAEIEEPYLTLLVLGTIPALLAGLGAIGWRNRPVAA